MRYIATIRLNKEKRTYLIDAIDETQVKERLLLRLYTFHLYIPTFKQKRSY